jgi:hypothetical protein
MTLEPEGHTGDDLCRFSWDTQITPRIWNEPLTENERSIIKKVAQAHRDEARKWLNHCLLVDENVAARLRLLEDVALAARSAAIWGTQEGQNRGERLLWEQGISMALRRLDAEGSR